MIPSDVLAASTDPRPSVPIYLLPMSDGEPGTEPRIVKGLDAAGQAWLQAIGWSASSFKPALVPGEDGGIKAIVAGTPSPGTRDWTPLFLGGLPAQLPAGVYHLASPDDAGRQALIAWGLGCYRFDRYKPRPYSEPRVLKAPAGMDPAKAAAIVEGIWLGRDLINTPASDMGPDELEAAARALAKRHGAKCSAIVGEALLAGNFPLIHAVGRASPRAPRLIEITWARPKATRSAMKVTLIGKGVCFDTGGLDIKSAPGMALMKKDMGGAATALALAHMIMSAKLDVSLRVLIPAVENSIAGNAFRPGDVLKSRAGRTVEIGNTDAEGRLVLADALCLAGEQPADLMVTFATLTGAARAALGPDLPPFYTDDEQLAGELAVRGLAVGDPVWRLPLWKPYDKLIDSEIAEVNNSYESPFAGSITAALFLHRFVEKAQRYAHFDIYGWVPSTTKPGQPKGGEAQAARLMFEVIRARSAR